MRREDFRPVYLKVRSGYQGTDDYGTVVPWLAQNHVGVVQSLIAVASVGILIKRSKGSDNQPSSESLIRIKKLFTKVSKTSVTYQNILKKFEKKIHYHA